MFSGPCELNDLRQIINRLTRYMCIEIAASACFKLNLNLQSQWNIGWLPRQNICLTISSYTEFSFFFFFTYTEPILAIQTLCTITIRFLLERLFSWDAQVNPLLRLQACNTLVETLLYVNIFQHSRRAFISFTLDSALPS